MPKPADPRGIYFNSKLLGEPRYDYVCWLDVMGTTNQMLRSLPIAANFIYKLQSAALEARDEANAFESVRLFPTIDGMYITSPSRWPLQEVINQTMIRCALTFIAEQEPHHRFLVRGAIAFGPVYYGMDLPNEANYTMANNPQVRDTILMGLPVGQAHTAEAESAPFGISIHSSARAFSPRGEPPFGFIWLNWFRYSKPEVSPETLLGKMDEYFKWQRDHTTVTGYKLDRLDYHYKLAREFFSL